MKWLFYLVLLTLFFIISSFFISKNLVLAYRWMTLGMALISFIFYFITVKNNPKNIGGNLLAIVVKFILSSVVFISYFIVYHSKNKIDYYYFIAAYLLFSVVSYVGAYNFSKNQSIA